MNDQQIEEQMKENPDEKRSAFRTRVNKLEIVIMKPYNKSVWKRIRISAPSGKVFTKEGIESQIEQFTDRFNVEPFCYYNLIEIKSGSQRVKTFKLVAPAEFPQSYLDSIIEANKKAEIILNKESEPVLTKTDELIEPIESPIQDSNNVSDSQIQNSEEKNNDNNRSNEEAARDDNQCSILASSEINSNSTDAIETSE